jgi:trehalose 6-phosphate phosphatase
MQLPDRAALLLDLDGTLIDLAPTPDSVVVPADLPGVLIRLRDRLDGALAVVTGRPIETVDALLPGVATAVAGEHGGAIRHWPDAPVERAQAFQIPEAWLPEADEWVRAFPGALVERKARGFVLHFRLAPEAGPILREKLAALMGDWPHHQVSTAHMAWEIKPAGIDKGGATTALMARPPFAGRVPVFVGDDVTDEDGMRVARAMGGLGLRVQDHFTDASGVRRWLHALADQIGVASSTAGA